MTFNLSTASAIRTFKISSCLFAGFFGLLVCFGNITDYQSNYHFVSHVLAMDTIFPNSALAYRSIQSIILYNVFYIFIMAAEGIFGALCLIGAYQMLIKFNASAEKFHSAKKYAIWGLLIANAIWYFGFQVIGGEWFAMWQSSTWNGLNAADRIMNYIFPLVIFFKFKNR